MHSSGLQELTHESLADDFKNRSVGVIHWYRKFLHSAKIQNY